ncbi:regulator of MON1-CCZ1 complex [Sabethes cyaneus]|uniref:regulator of MON1-CCZ1 complex n=1 Tax=Sabethes cyaneus TaxID=53552 RepID=UPI00237EC011|nr:regulator of MON1-CCZ1 complex [Sabethes cyaneus]
MDKSVDLQHYYLELSPEPVRFEAVSPLTNVFFDDAKQQVFAVRSGGATGIVVKSANDTQNISFCMEDRGTIQSIKFSADNQVLAVQRNDTTVEFVPFNANNQPNVQEMLTHQGKNVIYGFVWVQERQVALISKAGVEIFQLNFEKRTLKSIKSLNLTVNWFSFCPTSSFALLSSNNGTILTPVILKASTITKLPRLELGAGEGCLGRNVTLAQLYGTNAIMILKELRNHQFEVVIYLLNGPGLAPRERHILRLGQNGRFAMNIVDDVVVVHHQATATSMLFDVALGGAETKASGVIVHQPIIPAKTIKPYTLEVPSMSLDGKTINCDLYSQYWVLFQPNIVIDAKLGCLWHVLVKLNSLCAMITDRFRLVEFLLQRTEGKPVLLNVLKEMMTVNYSGTMLPVIESIFNKLNGLYKGVLDSELQSQMALMALSTKTQPSKSAPAPRVIIDQSDIYTGVFSAITETEQLGKILLLYLHSLARNGITANPELSKQIVIDLVRNKQFDTLQQLLKYSALNESKPLACFLLSLSNSDPSISQMALDMLARLNANEIILEVLLEKGQVVEALRIAKQMPGADSLPARKYLEAAFKTKDPLVFHSVYNFFQAKNVRLRGSPDFLKHEQCTEYVQHYQTLISTQCL